MRDDGAIGISLSQFSKKLQSFKDRRVRIGKKEKKIPPIPVSFHHSVFSVVCLLVGISLCLIV